MQTLKPLVLRLLVLGLALIPLAACVLDHGRVCTL